MRLGRMLAMGTMAMGVARAYRRYKGGNAASHNHHGAVHHGAAHHARKTARREHLGSTRQRSR